MGTRVVSKGWSRSSARASALAGCGLAAFVAAAPPVIDAPVRTVLIAAGMALWTAVAVLTRSAPVVRLALAVDTVFACFAVGAHAGLNTAVTTASVCVVPLLVLRAAHRWAWLRPTMSWLRWGRPGPDAVWLAGATVAASAAGLVVWTLLYDPSTSAYLTALGTQPMWLALIGVVAFSLVNPIWEEVLFRGVLQGELSGLFGGRPAVVLQAVAFGLAHQNGFPSGWVGMLMAFLWALSLGILRHRTGGIGVPYLAHVAANVTIGLLAVFLLG